MKCKQCNTEFESKRKTAVYCSAKCRKLAFQVSVPENGKVSVPANKTVSVPTAYTTVDDSKVYGRQAVRYELSEPWNLRPEPLSLDDVPVPNNRGRYTRPDSSQYLFDYLGKAFELTDGKVYPEMSDLRATQPAGASL